MTPTTQEKISTKFREIREDLKQITDALVQQAKTQKREEYKPNSLLREYYELNGKTTHTFDEWKDMNYSIRKGEHAYRFWGKPVNLDNGKHYCPVIFLFSQDQVILNAVAA